jgi:hypothetical protein
LQAKAGIGRFHATEAAAGWNTSNVGCLLKQCPQYRKDLRTGTIPKNMGRSAVGIDFVRNVRNKFAHGSARLGMPDSKYKRAANGGVMAGVKKGAENNLNEAGRRAIASHYRGAAWLAGFMPGPGAGMNHDGRA